MLLNQGNYEHTYWMVRVDLLSNLWNSASLLLRKARPFQRLVTMVSWVVVHRGSLLRDNDPPPIRMGGLDDVQLLFEYLMHPGYWMVLL